MEIEIFKYYSIKGYPNLSIHILEDDNDNNYLFNYLNIQYYFII